MTRGDMAGGLAHPHRVQLRQRRTIAVRDSDMLRHFDDRLGQEVGRRNSKPPSDTEKALDRRRSRRELERLRRHLHHPVPYPRYGALYCAAHGNGGVMPCTCADYRWSS
jgi:hypothetical protein